MTNFHLPLTEKLLSKPGANLLAGMAAGLTLSLAALSLPAHAGGWAGLAAAGVSGLAKAAGGQQIQGKVIYTDDGDTVVMLTQANEQVKIRLASIDAPESSHTNHEAGRVGQPFSANSKRYLQQMVQGKAVTAQCPDVDRYGRQICTLFVDGVDVNKEMVRSGWAWANTASAGRYLRDPSMIQLQAEARAARRGLWAGGNPVPPWDWRHVCWETGNCPI